MPPRAFSLSVRLWLTALLALIGSVALLVVSMRTIDEVKIRSPLYQDIVSYKDLLADILPPPAYLIESYLTCFELTKAKGPEQEELLKRLSRLDKEYQERNNFWQTELKLPALRKTMLEDAAAPAQEFLTTLKTQFIPAIQRNDLDAAQKILEGPLTSAYRKHRSAVDSTVELANKEVLSVEATADSTLSRSITTLFGYALAINILVLTLTFLSIRSILKPMSSLATYAKRVSTGDYDCQCDIKTGNEIGNLATILSDTVSKIQTSITQAAKSERVAQEEAHNAHVASAKAEEAMAHAEQAKQQGMFQAAIKLEKVVEVVGAASEQLATQVEQANKGAQAQAHKAAEVATAMEEMNASVLEVASNATKTAATSTLAQSKAKAGAMVVEQVITGIGEVRGIAVDLKTQMTELGVQSEGIGQILNVISDIADQTNLLALNAAIEAARAGDAGRGFAVVADEVRKLAEKTMTATKQVGDAIKSVQKATRVNIARVDEAVRSISGATDLAGESGHALDQIVALVEAASGQVQAIAASAEQQSAASEEINHAVEDVNQVAKQSSLAMGDAARAVVDLARQAEELRNLIHELKSDAQVETVR